MLDRGRVAELGSHEELLELGGRYAAMAGAQVGPAADAELAAAG